LRACSARLRPWLTATWPIRRAAGCWPARRSRPFWARPMARSRTSRASPIGAYTSRSSTVSVGSGRSVTAPA
jgi:hypothetical protein